MSLDAELLLRSAGLAGRHALPIFLTMLALLLAAVCAVAWVVQRSPMRRLPHTQPSLRVLGARLLAGFAVIVAGAWVFAELAEKLGAGRLMGRADQALADGLLASVPAPVMQVFAAITHLGDPLTLTGLSVVVALMLVATGRRWLAFGWVATVAGNGLLNRTLKEVFARVRPLHDDTITQAQGFSFPSGHSSGSVVVFGMLAYLALRLLPPRWHLPVGLAAVALAFSVGASRVFLRVHFASDVIAGFASGAVWLTVCIVSIELTRWVGQRGGGR